MTELEEILEDLLKVRATIPSIYTHHRQKILNLGFREETETDALMTITDEEDRMLREFQKRIDRVNAML